MWTDEAQEQLDVALAKRKDLSDGMKEHIQEKIGEWMGESDPDLTIDAAIDEIVAARKDEIAQHEQMARDVVEQQLNKMIENTEIPEDFMK